MNHADRGRLDAPEATSHAWSQAADASNLPQHSSRDAHPTAAPTVETPTRPRKNLWRTAARIARDATIGLLLIAAIPLAYVAVNGDRVWSDAAGFRERIVQVEQLRPLVLPKDGRMSPAEAGYAFHALQPAKETEGFPMRTVPAAAEFGWQKLESTSHLFASYRAPKSGGLPSSTEIVTAAAVGFTDDEMQFLRVIAEARVWEQVDKIVGANAVDLIGGRFVLPFKAEARAMAMPIHKFQSTKDLANAGVSRAAYYMALGETARAEAALKTVVSFGFVLIDNGTSAIDGLIGQVVANIGRDGLHQLYTLTGDEHGQLLTSAPPMLGGAQAGALKSASSAEATRARMLTDVADPTAPRTLRYEGLSRLSYGTCGSVSGMLFGHPEDTQAGYDEARQSLARFASEEALLDLYYNSPQQAMTEDLPSLKGMTVLAAAAVTATITNNPRVMTCTRLISTMR